MNTGSIGLDIGSRWVKAAQWFRIAGRPRLRSAAFPRSTPGAILNEQESARIAAILARRGFVGRSVALVAPADRARIAEIEVPAASAGAGRTAVARMELARVCRLEPQTFEFNAWDVQRAVRSGEASMAAAVMTHHDADSLVLPLVSAGLIVEAIRSVGESCGLMLGGIPGTIDTFADFGASGLSIAVLVGGVCVYERRLAELGLDALAKSIEEVLRVSNDHAHRVLVAAIANPSGSAHAAVAPVLRGFGTRIGNELAISLEYASHRYTNASEGRVLAVGGGACLNTVVSASGQSLGASIGTPRTFGEPLGDELSPAWPIVAVSAMAAAPSWPLAGGGR